MGSTPRWRTGATLAVATAVIATGIGLAWAAWEAAFPSDPDIDCLGYAFPTDSWSAALRAHPTDEAVARRLARNVVRCTLVLDRTPRQVRALLGSPDSAATDGNPRPHRDWSYHVGVARNILDEKDVSLHMEFDRGHVVYVNAPGRDPGQRGGDISAGAPVGGGPRQGGRYSTVTVFARLRGWSTFSPRERAT